jgi:Tol biopolymer transport system component
MIAFISLDQSSSARDVSIINSNGDGLTNLTKLHNINLPNYPVWTPDGSRIAFVDCQEIREFRPADGNKLYVMNRDGTNLINMELSTKNLVPGCSPVSWSPDGKRIAFLARPTDFPHYLDIYILLVESQEVRNLSGDFKYDGVPSCQLDTNTYSKDCHEERSSESIPVWSLDGRVLAIAFRRAVASGISESEIYTFDEIGSNLRKLTDRNGNIDAINWTPDGKSIVFTDLDENVIYSVTIETGEIKRLGEGIAPTLSPDGTHLAYSKWNTDIHVVDINGQNVSQITSMNGRPYRWSPDGNTIVFIQQLSIWIASKEGSWKKELIKGADIDGEFSVSR